MRTTARVWSRRLKAGLALLLFAALSACPGNAVDESATASRTSPTTGGPGEIVVPTCDDTVGIRLRAGGTRFASCAAGFYIGDVFHSVSCGAVRSDLVTNDVLAEGSYFGQPIQVRTIAGVDPAILLAVSLDGGICADGDVRVSFWSMLFVGSRPPAETQESVCRASVTQHLERNNCQATPA